MKVGIIVQARMNSTRVPRKVAIDLNGKPLLWHVLMGLKKVRKVSKLIVATGPIKQNLWIINFCKKCRISTFSYEEENDVLSRFYFAAKKYKLDHVVRICADNAFVAYGEISHLISEHLKRKADYSTNLHTFNIDLGAEIFTFKALENTHKKASEPYNREHVTTYIYKTSPKDFNILEVTPKYHWPKINTQLCIDRPEDIKPISDIYKQLFVKKRLITQLKLKKYLRKL